MRIQLLVVQMFSASALKLGYGPWVLTASLPLGALFSLVRRPELRRPPQVAPTDPAA